MSSVVTEFIEISPITKTKTVVYTKMLVNVQDVWVGRNMATVKVSLYTELHDDLREFIYEITGDDYKQWTDDAYLVSFVKNRLRFETF